MAWAAVGEVPAELALPQALRLPMADVPLGRLPPWLGVDRALVGWRAWQRSQAPVLVADAGTALSLTRISAEGCFAGGRLLAGAALQWRALGSGTAALPGLEPPITLLDASWPQATAEALAAGVVRGLAAAVAEAAREVSGEDPGCSLWITGGDGALLAPLVEELLAGIPLAVHLAPTLALEALALLRPAPGR